MTIYANCEICGKRDKALKLLIVGGPWSHLCENCIPIVDKIINRYLLYLRHESLGMVVNLILKAEEERGKEQQ